MRVKHLEPILANLDDFEDPKLELEQFMTPPHIAANMLKFIESDLRGKVVADLGSGCGMLSIAASLLGAEFVVGFEVDGAALATAMRNRRSAGCCGRVDFVQSDVRALPASNSKFDTVLMNPPFGTVNKGIDSEFLFTAASLARRHIYSLHKMSTMDHIEKVASVLKLRTERLDAVRYNLSRTYRHHRRDSKDIEVCLVRFSKIEKKKKKKQRIIPP